MNFGVGDYYSLVGNRYVRYANVQVVGVDSNQPYQEQKPQKIIQPDIYHSQKNLSKSVIEEQEIEYDLQQSLELKQNTNKKKHFKGSILRDKTEVNSLYVKDENNEGYEYPTYSLITSNQHQNRSAKQKLEEMQKVKFKSEYQEDYSTDEKELYIQLQKEKKRRRDLQKEYKKLLLKLRKSQNGLQYDYNEKESVGLRKRQYSKGSFQQNRAQPILFSCKSARLRRASVKMRDRVDSTELYPTKQIGQKNHNLSLESQIPEFQSSQQNSKQQNEKNQVVSPPNSQQSQRIFQQNLIQQLRFLYEKIEKMDSFLQQRQKILQNQTIKRQIDLKQKQIMKLKWQKYNQMKPQNQKPFQQSTQASHPLKFIDLSFLNKMQKSSLYVLCLAIMIFIVILT